MQKIKIIILDFDGTIGDTVKVIINTMQATIRELHLPARTDEQCKKMIGLTLMDTPAALFPELHKMPSEDSNEFHKRKEQLSISFTETYRRIFSQFNTPGAVTLFPNVLPTLKKLKGGGKNFYQELTAAASEVAAEFDGRDLLTSVIDSLTKEIE